MRAPGFVHGDTVKVLATSQVGTVKAVHRKDSGNVYEVQFKTSLAEIVNVREDELQLVAIANDGETGFHIRYIS
jgi:hypothetical protein